MYISTVKRIIIKNIENLIFMNKKMPVFSIFIFWGKDNEFIVSDNGNFFLIGASPLAEG